AAQATTAVDLDTSQRSAQEAAGTRPERLGEGVAEQVGLARRESPHKASRLLGLAKVLEREMPHTLALMREGRLNEWRATILARETACLSVEHRAEVDRRLCATGEAATMSDNALTRAAKKLACDLDAASVVARARRAESERNLSIRPAPDTMCWVTALLPVKAAVSVYATLLAAANAARAQGDERSKGQVMADTLVARVTGAPADETPKVEVKLVMTDQSLVGTSDEAAHLAGYGPVPAPWARAFVADATGKARAFIRRLYVTPTTGELIGMDSRARLAPKSLADFIATRDLDLCRTPWCGAPIAQTDHAKAFADGGATSAANSQGLCQRCNLAKQALGWSARQIPGPGRHTVETTTPTGHRHRSRAPAPPGHVDIHTPGERLVLELIA
ncbi:MAG: endonuclease, partial [Nocardioides sp.]|nr:endonuclease [Nocardioides sp.]